ncbi:MAG: DMT family transporter [Alphaproteobacteria bacterium]
MKTVTFGVVLALLSAALFSVNTPIAAYGQAQGGDALVFTLVRGASTALVSGGLALLIGASFRVPRRHWPALAVMVIAISLQGMCYLTSVGYIPVGLAALLFYMHPILVALLTTVLKQGPTASRGQWFCFLAAFTGLGLALGPEVGGLDWRGVALAFAAALTVAVYLVAARSSIGEVSFLALSFYGSAGTALFSFAAILFLRQSLSSFEHSVLTWPTLGIAVIFPAAYLVQLLALKAIDTKTLAILFNIEPVLSIAIAALFLNETLSLPQAIGALIVVVALSAYARLANRAASLRRPA